MGIISNIIQYIYIYIYKNIILLFFSLILTVFDLSPFSNSSRILNFRPPPPHPLRGQGT